MAGVSSMDIAWIAGLLEGEGCFFVADRRIKNVLYKRIGISLVMTDKAPVERAAELLRVNCYLSSALTSGGKQIFRSVCYGTKAAGWMMTIYDLMSPRRKSKIEECLSIWKSMPGKGYNQYRRRKEMTKSLIT